MNSYFSFLVVNQTEIEVDRILPENRELIEFERVSSNVQNESPSGKMALVSQIYLHHNESAENHLFEILWCRGKSM